MTFGKKPARSLFGTEMPALLITLTVKLVLDANFKPRVLMLPSSNHACLVGAIHSASPHKLRMLYL
jgi:hypothetical protein